jgi:ABC-type Fe3+-hydroxamate transport system substrate-binding protein
MTVGRPSGSGLVDDTGIPVEVPAEVRRVVSLVPSLSEAIAATAPGLLIGATDWCTHPADLDVVRIRGTKNPDVTKITALAPDLVLANFEENRAVDLEALRANGLAVWVTVIRTLPEAVHSLNRMLQACRLERPGWLDAAETAWQTPHARARPIRAIVPIWRRPWMVIGRETFAGDLLTRLGVANLYQDDPERYPKVPLERLRAAGAELVVLPDEPYAFGPDDGPECFPGMNVALVSGRDLTWYGPSLAEARVALDRQLAAAFPVRSS